VRTHLFSVGVGSFGVDTAVVDDVLEGVVHQTTVAALVAVAARAVDEVLLGQGDELVVLLEESSLHGAGLDHKKRSVTGAALVTRVPRLSVWILTVEKDQQEPHSP